MAMLHFQRSWLDNSDAGRIADANEGWGIDKGATPLAAVRAACDGYLPLNLRCLSEDGLDDYWCSYDKVSNSFHIVPFSDVGHCKDRLAKVLEKLEGLGYARTEDKVRPGNGPDKCTKNHFYIVATPKESDDYEYLCSFNRLSCGWGGVISNDLGRAQFYRYQIKLEDINWRWSESGLSKRERCMLYPSSSADFSLQYDANTGHCVYNAPYMVNPDGKDAEANAEGIAEAFVRFIRFFQDGKHEIAGGF